jgi:hypothetical protein
MWLAYVAQYTCDCFPEGPVDVGMESRKMLPFLSPLVIWLRHIWWFEK